MKKQLDIKKLILLNLPYILMGLVLPPTSVKRGGWPWVRTLRQKCSRSSPRCRWRWPAGGPACTRWTCWWACAAAAGLRLAVYLKSKNAKKYRHGMEYGSARWGTHEDIAPYIDPVFQNNVILTKTESLTMNSRPKDPKTARNKNVLVIGGSGSGKTRFWLKPSAPVRAV